MIAIDSKMWRDLWKLKGQAIAISLVISCGVAIYIMFVSTLDALNLTRDSYYQQHRFADVFTTLKRAPNSLRQRIAEIPGVNQVELRVAARVNIDVANFSEPISGLITSVSDDGHPLLNVLYLREGRYPVEAREDEIIISAAFADAHQLRSGDSIHAIINGRRENLIIVGVAWSPEYIHQLRPGGVFPDYKRFGVLWMTRAALSHAYDMDGAFNNVVLKLQAGTNAQDVIDQLDDLLDPYGGQGAYARVDQRSHRFLTEEFKQLQNLANIFPLLFLGIAVFLLNVVVGRLVSTQREQIATLKAFGYNNITVMWHYLKMVLVIVSSGVITGVGIGVWLGRELAAIYTEFFHFPFLLFQLRPSVATTAIVASSLAAVLGTVMAVRRAAILRPAEAMRPEAPALYRVSLLERLGIQRWLSQPDRMILRHIGRRPVKSLLTVVGIAMACGITMTGRFQQDTVNYMLDIQYGLSQREDISVTFSDPVSSKSLYSLQSLYGVTHAEVFRSVPARLRFEHRSYTTAIKGIKPDGDIHRLLDTELNTIRLPEDGIVLTDFLADMLGVKSGDSLTVEILEGDRPVRNVTVVGLAREYLGVRGYMDLAALNRFMHEGPTVSGVYLAVDAAVREQIFHELKNMPRVAGIAIREQEIKNFNDVMQETMLFYTFIASIFSVIIAFGVIYNSARIALTERGRELASLRVLGFTRGEVAYILLGELGLLVIVALPLGILMGQILCAAIARDLQSDLYRVPLILEPGTYAFATTVVVLSALVSGMIVRRKLGELDLIGVLKTRD